MVGCTAIGCTNRSEKGMPMYGFPKDTARRTKWLAQVHRRNLTITTAHNNRKLCAAHFERGQFTKTHSGRVRLRADAVPTIFAHRPQPRRMKAPAMRSAAELPLHVDPLTSDHAYCSKVNFGSPSDSSVPSTHQTDMMGSVSLKKEAEDEEEEVNPPPVKIIPIPVQPVGTSNCPTPNMTVKSADSAYGFRVNGRRIPFRTVGDKTVLRLRNYPKGSASSFTTIQMPANLTLRSTSWNHPVTTAASSTASVTSTPTPPSELAPPPGSEPIPIITGVVSGEAAQKVLNDHNVDFKSSPLETQKTSPSAEASATKPKKQQSKSLSSNKLTAPDKPLRKGKIGPVTPPNCSICLSQYKLVKDLRGFMCMCCPAIARSLQNQRKQRIKQQRRKRERSKFLKMSRGLQISSKVPKLQQELPVPAVKVSTPPRTHRFSDDFLSDELSSPDTFSPLPLDKSPSEAPESKLVILLEDFYYGCANGVVSDKLLDEKFNRPFRCIHCSETFFNNIKLMDHIQQHTSEMTQQKNDTDSVSSCPHCFRNFQSSFRLQCHMEVVHSQRDSTVTCKICELAFNTEPAFMYHMKNTHKPGEMPYSCQVCDFRSSFYNDIWLHFRAAHADTKNLLCPYCLRVLRLNLCYQKHVIRHQKKHVLSCNKCRLHFLYLKERTEHIELHHKTHVTPPQLSGLKPGTRVTVRTYSGNGAPDAEEAPKKLFVPCKVVEVTPPPPQEDVKRKPFESLGSLLSGLSAEGNLGSSQRCIECLNSFPDLKVHFPTLVNCSLCKFSTCCSNSYANHMINNHTNMEASQFATIFLSNPSSSQMLRCSSCQFSTYKGDTMAIHLTERPDHDCIMAPEDRLVSIKSADEDSSLKQVVNSESENASSKVHEGFIPIQLGQMSPQLSVKPLQFNSPSSFKPAMTIKFLGSGQPKAPCLSLSQLSVVLSSLCHGISETSRRYKTSPATIRSWIAQQQRGLTHRKWRWRTDKMAEWVLNRREQQLIVGEDVLLLTAKAALGEGVEEEERYSWTIDFLLRHDLGLQTTNNNKLKSIQDNSRTFIHSLYARIQSGVLPLQCWGCMDELPVFISSDLFSKQDSSSFQLFGSLEDKPTFDIIISALSDGSFLPPLLFFTGTASDIPEGFPDNVRLIAREEGFTDEDRLEIWIDKVWRSRVSSKHNRNSLLVVDVHRGHLSNKFKEGLSAIDTDLACIPPGCSCHLQPLEICVTQVLRDFLQARWTQLVSEEGLDGLGLDQLALTLACWLSEVSFILNSQMDILRRSFSLACSLQPGDGQGEVARMITALTESLIQPVETEEPGPGTNHKTEPEPHMEVSEEKTEPEPQMEVSEEKTEPEPHMEVSEEKTEPEPHMEVSEEKTEPELQMEVSEEKTEPEPQMEVSEEKTEPEPQMEVSEEKTEPEPQMEVSEEKTEPEPQMEVSEEKTEPEPQMEVSEEKTEAEPQMEVKENSDQESTEEQQKGNQDFASGLSALRQVFNGESDNESFYGFPDS